MDTSSVTIHCGNIGCSGIQSDSIIVLKLARKYHPDNISRFQVESRKT